MEEQRLKPMVTDYDVNLFNSIYKDTRNLVRTLAYGIDHRRFGYDKEEIQSWFDVKLIFAFNKYYPKTTPDELKGYIIKSLQLFKCRILRSAYTVKYSQKVCSLEEHLINDENYFFSTYSSNLKSEIEISYYEQLVKFIKPIISIDAFYLFEFELNPPPYIFRRLCELKIHNTKKVPDSLLIEYFELESYNYLASLKQEIAISLKQAKEHFNKVSQQ